MSLLSYLILFGFAIIGINYWLQTKSYLFTHEEVSKIAKRHAGKGEFAACIIVPVRYSTEFLVKVFFPVSQILTLFKQNMPFFYFYFRTFPLLECKPIYISGFLKFYLFLFQGMHNCVP